MACDTIGVILQRRAVKRFEPAVISVEVREQILKAALHAPSSFNLQPYKLFWVESPNTRADVAKLCLGQKPAATASALVVAVADIASLAATSHSHAQWMRATGVDDAKIRDYEKTARIGRILFMPGPLGTFAAIKWLGFQTLNRFKVLGMPPLFRHQVFQWASKSTALACQNLMLAAEALGLCTCPMEGFDGRRLLRFLHLPARSHQVVMVIAIGRKPEDHTPPPQWRRPLETTVTYL